MFTKSFLKQAVERAVKAAATALLAAWVVGDQVMNAWALDPKEGLGVALGGLISSLLLSIASLPVGEPGSPSAVKIETTDGSATGAR